MKWTAIEFENHIPCKNTCPGRRVAAPDIDDEHSTIRQTENEPLEQQTNRKQQHPLGQRLAPATMFATTLLQRLQTAAAPLAGFASCELIRCALLRRFTRLCQSLFVTCRHRYWKRIYLFALFLYREAPDLSQAAARRVTISASRFGAVLMWVAYKVKPVKARPPTRLPRTVGISFQMK